MPAKPSILVVEDDACLRDLVLVQLRAAGYVVHAAHNGVEAMAKIAEVNPHAMILDINMPEMDGFSVLEALRKDSAARRMPVMVLTARHAAGDVKRALGLGAKDYLAKPFNEAQLAARVTRLVRPQLSAQRRLEVML